ncbi:MAG: T9SS type A sorting domain-containing protein [Flavobacterium sp.]|uniref:T9SS type A sorting domain-containing protein n=1 Tax=Flavobacterium sp. TaxID=239 RepID=UPI00260336D6|nr:T9SS type A sorting domain-containing protein [Flavobacterium sp.]MDD5151853.1 T9SS type A sorting domain-containing protein [Flavobacterium sp.]
MKYNYSNFKTFCTIGLLWSSCFTAYSQDILWEKSYGGQNAEYLFDAQPTADYGFILAGSSLSDKSGNKTDNNNGDLDYWVWKMDEKGELDWQKSFGGSGFDLLQSIKNTRDGGFILAGTSSSNVGFQKKDSCRGVTDFWVIKLDAKGEEQWQKTIGGSGQEDLICAFQTRDGGYILGGSSSSSPAIIENNNPNEKKTSDVKPDLYAKTEKSRGNMDYWIVKLDKNGTVQWQKTYGGEYADLLRSMEQTKDGGYILGGYSNSSQSGEKTDDNTGIGDYWIVKIDDIGNIEWQKTYGGNGDNQLYVIHQTEDGGYIAGGNSNSTTPLTSLGGNVRSGTDFWVLKMDEKGALVWSETYDFGKVDILTSLVENKDHTYLIGGYAQNESSNTLEKGIKKDEEVINDYIALKIDEKGERLWDKTVGSDGEDILRKLIETRDGGYLLAGTSNAQAVSGTLNKLTRIADNGDPNQQLQKGTNAVNNSITEVSNDANNAINNQLAKTTGKINDAISKETDSRVKLGLNSPVGGLNLPSMGSGNSANGSNTSNGQNEKKLPASKDKFTSFGNNDFWVVKLKDKTKPKVIKVAIEVIPNPTVSFTNIIIGYEFESGTATVVDMAGRILQRFNITSRTVPIDLSPYPDGVYVVNIKTNVQSDGVKIIKGGFN